MVEMKGNGINNGAGSKKRMLASDIAHKFSSKDDFLYFFSKQVSLTFIIYLLS